LIDVVDFFSFSTFFNLILWIGRLFSLESSEFIGVATFFPVIINTLFLYIIKGPIGEQAGWHGFGYSKMMEKNSFLKSSINIGFSGHFGMLHYG
jgi:hypothetical protein